MKPSSKQIMLMIFLGSVSELMPVKEQVMFIVGRSKSATEFQPMIKDYKCPKAGLLYNKLPHKIQT